MANLCLFLPMFIFCLILWLSLNNWHKIRGERERERDAKTHISSMPSKLKHQKKKPQRNKKKSRLAGYVPPAADGTCRAASLVIELSLPLLRLAGLALRAAAISHGMGMTSPVTSRPSGRESTRGRVIFAGGWTDRRVAGRLRGS